MFEMVAFFLSEVWKHRKNRFIAVGGITVLFVGIMMGLVKVPGVPDWLVSSVAFCTGCFVVATLAMMVYYAAKFVVIGILRLVKMSNLQVGRGKSAAVEVSTVDARVLGDLNSMRSEEDFKESKQ